MYVSKFKPRSRRLKIGLVVVGRLGRGAVDDLEQDAYTDQCTVELDIETGKPLCRLIGQQERRNEGEKLAWRGACLDHTIAAIGDGNRKGAPTESFHQGAGAIGYASHLVGFIFDRCDIPVETLAHDVFEREGFHDADALQGLLQCFDNAGSALKLGACDRINATDQFTENEECRRSNED